MGDRRVPALQLSSFVSVKISLNHLKAIRSNHTGQRLEILEVAIFSFKDTIIYLLSVQLLYLGDRCACVCPCVGVLGWQQPVHPQLFPPPYKTGPCSLWLCSSLPPSTALCTSAKWELGVQGLCMIHGQLRPFLCFSFLPVSLGLSLPLFNSVASIKSSPNPSTDWSHGTMDSFQKAQSARASGAWAWGRAEIL